jgi:hypothetical protein
MDVKIISLENITMPDITNYAYIWYNEAKPLPDMVFNNGRMTIQGQTISNIITSYSYPCYLANKDVSSLSEPDKHRLLHDEIGFLRDKMISYEINGYYCLRDITLVQIPRMLYDLLCLIYFVETDPSISVIDINCSSDFKNYASYLQRILSIGDDKYKLRILQLNAFILNKIGYIVGGGEPPTSYDMKTDKPASTSPMEITGDLNTNVRSFLSDRNKACESILEHILHADHIIYTHPRIHLNLTPPTKELFRQVLRFELQESSGYTTLYRGSVLENDSLIRHSARGGVKMLQSVSFNTSILSGCIHDDTACTLFYMEPTSTHDRVGALTNSGKNDNIRYSLKKFLKGDNSNEDSLFFIPPIHPLLQLNAQGELFHPRTKVNLGDIEKKKVGGLNCTNAFIRGCDYLQSDKSMEELDALYKRFKATGVIDKWYTEPEHQRQYETSRTVKKNMLSILLERKKSEGGSTQRRSSSSRSSMLSNKRMKVTRSVDKLRGRGMRRRTCKRMRLR